MERRASKVNEGRITRMEHKVYIKKYMGEEHRNLVIKMAKENDDLCRHRQPEKQP
jgi:hypothetical protein